MSQQFSPNTLNKRDGNNQCSPVFKTFQAGTGHGKKGATETQQQPPEFMP